MRPHLLKPLLILSILTLLAFAGTSYAIPRTINYQGLLLEDGTAVDGTRDVTFRIYDSAEGGNILWHDTYTVTFSAGVFNVILGSTVAIPDTVFSGARRWLSISVNGGAEILPRGELASVGYAFHTASSAHANNADEAQHAHTAQYAANAGDAQTLDEKDSSWFARSTHSHDTQYYKQSVLNTSDGTGVNQGETIVDWENLGGVPAGFADGTDNVGEGPTDHSELTGLDKNDHPQYALKDTLAASDDSPPNEGFNLVHWDILTGVPAGFSDETDDITTDASLIATGTMDPDRIAGTAVVNNDARLLTVEAKAELTGGDTTALHYHAEVGDVASVMAGEGLSGGGTEGDVTVSHAEDASSLPFAHQYPPIVAHVEHDFFESNDTAPTVIDSVVIDAPADGFLFVTFCGTQMLDMDLECCPPVWVPKRYIARYGIGVDTTSAMTFEVTSSMGDSTYWAGGAYVTTKIVSGSTVRAVSEGPHTVYLLTHLALEIDSDADNNLSDASLTAIYLPYDATAFASALLLGGRRSDLGRHSRVPDADR
jgi:hypothetical protein